MEFADEICLISNRISNYFSNHVNKEYYEYRFLTEDYSYYPIKHFMDSVDLNCMDVLNKQTNN